MIEAIGNVKLLHVVESAKSHIWFEKLVESLYFRRVPQEIISIQKRVQVGGLSERNAKIQFGPTKYRWLNIIFLLNKVRRIRIDHEPMILAQGHLASIFAYLSNKCFKVPYGIIHHQSPIVFFDKYAKIKPINGKVHSYLYRCYISRAKFIQALSYEVRDSLIILGYPPDKIYHLSHGIEVDSLKKFADISKMTLRARQKNFTILMVGRLSWEKNYKLGLEVIEHIRKEYPHIRVVIAGEGPERKQIESLIREKNLGKNIQLIGWTNKVRELMCECDLLLHLSFTESYGLVILEACILQLDSFSFSVGVARDLSSEKNPFINILTAQNSIYIAEKILNFIKKSKPKSDKKLNLRRIYSRHEIDYVYGSMGNYLLDELGIEGTNS